MERGDRQPPEGPVSFQQMPRCSARTLDVGGRAPGRGSERGRDLTWNMTRRATASTLFMGFPAGGKARALLLGREPRDRGADGAFGAFAARSGGAAFAETERQNQIVPRSNLAGGPDSLPSPPLPPPWRGSPTGADENAGLSPLSGLFRASLGVRESSLAQTNPQG